MKQLVTKISALLRPSSRQNEVIGIEFCPNGVAFAHIQRPATQQPRLVHCDFLLAETDADSVEVLRARLTKLGLQHLPCHIVLNSGSYQLLLGEAPKVPAEELAEALRWRVKDLVSFPITEAVVDAFLLPEDSVRGTSRMAYAVVVQRKAIEALVEDARAANLALKAIDIPELALRNVVYTCCDTKRGVALVKLTQGSGSLQIIRDDNVYLSRQFSIAYQAGLLDELPTEALVLELQRSLDYFERQMRQTPPTHVYLCGDNVTPDKVTDAIRHSLTVGIHVLDVSQGVQIDESIPQHNLPMCLNALGVALRQDVVGER